MAFESIDKYIEQCSDDDAKYCVEQLAERGKIANWKKIAVEAGNIIRGFLNSLRKSRISTGWINTETFKQGDYREDAAQWLFKYCGMYQEDWIPFLTPKQQAIVEENKKLKGMKK